MAVHIAGIESAIRLAVALALGSAIGFERQWNQKMAGLRTNALVALGAGVILREGINVHGINTAATLWCSAMVGTFAGGGFWVPSLVAASFVIVTNLCLRPLVRNINRRMIASGEAETTYTVSLACRSVERRTSDHCCCTPCRRRASACGASIAAASWQVEQQNAEA
jgi:putative Mg2+ transporter-C (MgtC) family protein